MPAMLFAGAPYRRHGTGRPRRPYECPRAIARMQSGLLFATPIHRIPLILAPTMQQPHRSAPLKAQLEGALLGTSAAAKHTGRNSSCRLCFADV